MVATALVESLDDTAQKVVIANPFVSRRHQLESLIGLYIDIVKVYADRTEEYAYCARKTASGTREREHSLALGLLAQENLLNVYKQVADFAFYHPEEVALAFERMHKAFHGNDNSEPNYHLANKALSLAVALFDFKAWIAQCDTDGKGIEKYDGHENYSYLYRRNELV